MNGVPETVTGVIHYGTRVDPAEYPTLRIVRWAHVADGALAGAVFPRFH